ncbi:MAG: peptidase M28, partial [Deltaproteobacteria bacterium]|nr:peptidase M28 [Deltaproteobacteria bacterium]
RVFSLQYKGAIYHQLKPAGKEHARGFRQSPGIICKKGIYLGGAAYWYPDFGDSLVTFSLNVSLPAAWDAVCEGARAAHARDGRRTTIRWVSFSPCEAIHIVAAPFVEYDGQAGKTPLMVFLRSPDQDLADQYLKITARYLTLYENLIGPYPYKKFALVENFWETGYGMASFTLLGSRIIRFPFILYSSYPHEILHNWWGNSVFAAVEKGNWSEGLTAYLSDHLMKEIHGQGAAYRAETLQKYTDYVGEARDFPLTAFRSRHSGATEAVGYGKSLMVFHMLRHKLGDAAFVEGLRRFYNTFLFRFACFDDLQAVFEGIGGKPLDGFFKQWVTRAGAPELRVARPEVREEAGGAVLAATIEQVQTGPGYRLEVPVAVTLEGGSQAFESVVQMTRRSVRFALHVPARPLRLDVDPDFDVFRRLQPNEVPPALTQTLGSARLLVVLPSKAAEPVYEAYRGLALALRTSGPDEVEIRSDADLNALPDDRAVALLGGSNQLYREIFPALSEYGVSVGAQRVCIGKRSICRSGHTFVFTVRQVKRPTLGVTWIVVDPPEAFSGLARKLPHYQKYSYLVFEGPEPANIVKGRFPVDRSPMSVFLPGRDGTIRRVARAQPAPRAALASLP